MVTYEGWEVGLGLENPSGRPFSKTHLIMIPGQPYDDTVGRSLGWPALLARDD